MHNLFLYPNRSTDFTEIETNISFVVAYCLNKNFHPEKSDQASLIITLDYNGFPFQDYCSLREGFHQDNFFLKSNMLDTSYLAQIILGSNKTEKHKTF